MSSAIESITQLSKLSTPSQFSGKSSPKNINNKPQLQSISEIIASNKITYNKEKSQYEDLSIQIADKEQLLESGANKISKLKRKLLLLMSSITQSFIAHISDLYPRMNKRITDAIWGFFGFELAQSILMTSVIQTEAEIQAIIELSMVYQKNQKKASLSDFSSSYEPTKSEIKDIIANCKDDLLIYPFNVLFDIFNYIYDLCDLESKADSLYKSLDGLRKDKEVAYSNMLLKGVELESNEQRKESLIRDARLNNNYYYYNEPLVHSSLHVVSEGGNANKSLKKNKQIQETKKRNEKNRSYDPCRSTSTNSRNRLFINNPQISTSNNSIPSQQSTLKRKNKSLKPSFENRIIGQEKFDLNKNDGVNRNKSKEGAPIIKATNSTLSFCKHNASNTLKQNTAKAYHKNSFLKHKEISPRMKSGETTMASSLKSSSNNTSAYYENSIANNIGVKKAFQVIPINRSSSQAEDLIKQTKLLHKTSNTVISSKDNECVSEGFLSIKSYQMKEIKQNHYADDEEIRHNYCKGKQYDDNMVKKAPFINQPNVELGSFRILKEEKQCGCCVSCT